MATDLSHPPTENKKPCITCKWLQEEKILVNPDGQVLPCCYLGNTSFLNESDPTSGRMWDQEGFVLNEYKKNKEDFNLNNKTLAEILNSKWFNEDLPKSWERYDTLPMACRTFCDDAEV
jgi:hypothetical protein